MESQIQNPVTSMGSQGSQDFDSLTSGTSPQTNQKQTPMAPVSEGLPGEQLSDVTGAGKPAKSLPQTTESGQQPGTTPPGMSQADIIRATAEAVAKAHMAGQQSQQQQQVQAPRGTQDLSPEEFNKKFSVIRANEELVTTILGQDSKKAAIALDTYGQNLVKQAILMAMELTESNLGKFREEVNPHITSWQQYRQQQETVAAEQRFFKSAPDLANERDLVMELKDAFIARVRAGQVRFTNEAEAYSAVANAARSILKRVNPQWGAASGTQVASTTGQHQGRQMSAASSAGRSGTPMATAKSDVDLVFGADAH